ncbi:MAG: hypothetical protein B7Z55_03550 [Planctomycetales bacterium 12-60-4]|nr:MAG: hypothetical protein B7Z55_03550 [Planctomycetales bacterium 12-60-4]
MVGIGGGLNVQRWNGEMAVGSYAAQLITCATGFRLTGEIRNRRAKSLRSATSRRFLGDPLAGSLH